VSRSAGPRLAAALLPLLLPLLLALLFPVPARCLEVHLAPLAVVEEAAHGNPGEPEADAAAAGGRPEADLLRELRRLGTEEALVFRAAHGADCPGSLLEAAALCERQGYSCLLYGYLKRGRLALSAEIKLLDHDGGRLAAVFFGGDDPAHYDRLVRDLAAKVGEYFFSEMGLPPRRPAPPRRNRLELAAWLGYWTPLGGDWDRVLAGITAVGLGVRLIPADPLFRLGPRTGYLALELEGEYGLGMNEPGYESFFLHVARLRLAAEAMVELGGGHAAGLGAGLLAEADAAVQDRKYTSPFRGTTLAPGASLSLQYRYRLSDRLALGATALLEVVAYSPALVTFSPRLTVAFRKAARDD